MSTSWPPNREQIVEEIISKLIAKGLIHNSQTEIVLREELDDFTLTRLVKLKETMKVGDINE